MTKSSTCSNGRAHMVIIAIVAFAIVFEKATSIAELAILTCAFFFAGVVIYLFGRLVVDEIIDPSD